MSCAEPFSPSRVFDLLPYQQSNFPKADAFAYKAGGVWKKFSTNESIEIIDKLAWGLHLQGVRSGDRVASVSDNNRPEWNFLDNAVLSLGAIHVEFSGQRGSQPRRHPRPDLPKYRAGRIRIYPKGFWRFAHFLFEPATVRTVASSNCQAVIDQRDICV